jgi:type II secretory pathway pseudopilin PulG
LKPICQCWPAVRARRRTERGYAILLVLFLVTLMLIATISVAPNILTQGRREKETEMIWRGKQYTRAIKLYYRKTGKFPTSMDDLTKPKFGSLRFMRQAYKDPMNKKDGEWRLIYVGPTGRLIGSLKPPQTLQLSGLAGAGGALPGTPAAQLGAQSAGQTAGQTTGQTFGQAVGQIFGNSGAAAPSTPSNPANQPNTAGSANSGTSTDAPGTTPDTSDAANEALLASDPTTVMGGNIIGVGSTINQRSIIVYEKAKNYKQFEFIWDPSKDAIILGGAAGPQIGTPAGQPSNSSPFGQPNNSNPNSPGSPLNPQPNPPETTPAPPQ